MATVRVLHISDLHFGRRFGQPYWDNLVRLAETSIMPDVVAVTGDLVNSPYFWTLRRAAAALENLRARIEARSGHQCRMIVVPGNHDTRVVGNVPLRYVTVAALLAFAVAAGAFAWLGPGWPAVGLGIGALVIAGYRCLLQDFRRACGHLAPQEPQVLADLGLIIFPYDSATTGLSSARGLVETSQFVLEPAGGEHCFRMALVHHHPLPIPYDHTHEPLLVLDNAGAFLNEMSQKKIRLILHGHKHHENYARCIIRNATAGGFEVGVLASGTLTAAGDPGPHGFNFHALELSEDDGVVATPYTAPVGGTFVDGPRFTIEPGAVRIQRRFEDSRDDAGCEYGSVLSVRQINADGDVYARTEYRDFRVVKPGRKMSEIPPPPLRVTTETGYIERLSAGPVSRRGAADVRLLIDKDNPQTYSLSVQEGRLTFGNTIIDHSSDPISYYVAFDTLNGCALSAEQCRELYSGDEPPLEWLGIRLQTVPARNLILVVHLPRECRIEGEPELIANDPRERARIGELNSDLLYDRVAGTIIIRVPYPVLGVEYRVQWRLANAGPTSGIPDRLWGEVSDVTQWLLGLPAPAQTPTTLELVRQLLAGAHAEFSLAPNDRLDAALMAYDQEAHELRAVAASFQPGDERWNWRARYGNGIAGRAYKARRARLFIKEKAVREGTPLYYYPASGRPIRHPRDIPDEVVLALPLSHPEDARLVWGVLSISSSLPSSRLVELAGDDARIGRFWTIANTACFGALRAITSSTTRGPR